jgi:hypothetical protein
VRRVVTRCQVAIHTRLPAGFHYGGYAIVRVLDSANGQRLRATLNYDQRLCAAHWPVWLAPAPACYLYLFATPLLF